MSSSVLLNIRMVHYSPFDPYWMHVFRIGGKILQKIKYQNSMPIIIQKKEYFMHVKAFCASENLQNSKS